MYKKNEIKKIDMSVIEKIPKISIFLGIFTRLYLFI